MNRTRIVVCTLTVALALASVAGAAPTPEEKCIAAKLDAQRKKRFCVAGAQRAAILGKTADVAKCTTKFDKQIAAADKAAAAKGTSCRWLDVGDGTATDLSTGLQWELKTDDGSVHDKDNVYTWSSAIDGRTPNGTAFTEFLHELDGGITPAGVATPCFAGKCDWRLPTVEELRTILDAQYPNCTTVPPNACTTIPGLTNTNPMVPGYWTSTTDDRDPTKAWMVSFKDGFVSLQPKMAGGFTRAVRGEM